MWDWLSVLEFWNWNWVLIMKIGIPLWVVGWYPSSIAYSVFQLKQLSDSKEKCHGEASSVGGYKNPQDGVRFKMREPCEIYHRSSCWRAGGITPADQRHAAKNAMALAVIWPILSVGFIVMLVCSALWYGVSTVATTFGRAFLSGTTSIATATTDAVIRHSERADLSRKAIEAKKN